MSDKHTYYYLKKWRFSYERCCSSPGDFCILPPEKKNKYLKAFHLINFIENMTPVRADPMYSKAVIVKYDFLDWNRKSNCFQSANKSFNKSPVKIEKIKRIRSYIPIYAVIMLIQATLIILIYLKD